MSNGEHANELHTERAEITRRYHHLDTEISAVHADRAAALGDSSATHPETRWQRDIAVHHLSTRLSSLRAAENGLCFGRLDGSGGTAYVGRVGLYDEAADYEPLLLDWRAPAARPFYCASAAHPGGIARRRHFTTKRRTVLDFHDDVLDITFANAEAGADAALFAALNAPREDTMRDIVSTIQAEQDEIIRLPATGVVVIEGGPGTGKTAVALHRVAYLFYAQRERLSRSGVLIVGPNPGFLRYIGSVLPALGETDVVFAMPGELVPGLCTTVTDTPAVARIKGSTTILPALADAIADRQELPTTPIPITLDDVTVHLDRSVAEAARAAARATGLPHNPARQVFRDHLITALARRAVNQIGTGWLGPDETDDIRADLTVDVSAELRTHPHLRKAIDTLWPLLTPQRLLTDLYPNPTRLAALDALSTTVQNQLHRPADAPWTISDVPLLDELVDLLGPTGPADPDARRRAEEQERYARKVLTMLDTEEDPDGELLRAVDVLDAQTLAERQIERDHRDLAERAAADRDWAYGHLVVDEAQELSDMDWRVLMRRCPRRSMTVVGDLAQRQAPAGARDWAQPLAEHVAQRWVYRHLTVNYRTSAEIMALAARVLTLVDPALSAPASVRRTGVEPWSHRSTEADLATDINRLLDAELADLGAGRAAVIVPAGMSLDVSAPTYTPYQTKGLEFDVVIIAEPQRILDGGVDDEEQRTRAAELYVALTRATQRLGLVHTETLPDVLAG
jgi:DNA helicase IV